ncbi:MAG: hypothetical protein QOF48_122 [Verrucomicrobiota bacterium]|jgi:CheY-like chemotaxis protein
MTSTLASKRELPSRQLRFLLLEDVPLDASMIEARLRAEGLDFQSQVAASETAYRAALRDFTPDLILADFNLPGFDGLTALSIALERCRETPFIFVSGAVGEEMVIALLRAGATDVVLKNNLSRLAPAVFRAFQDSAHRSEARRAAQALHETIDVLHDTKRAFKSRTLGDLREKLQQLVDTTPWW